MGQHRDAPPGAAFRADVASSHAPDDTCRRGHRRMTASDDIEQLRREVQYLKDRTAIADCIANHARGCDRHDEELLASVYHDDGVDEHGTTINAGPEYAAWANAVHAATSQNHLHNVTT